VELKKEALCPARNVGFTLLETNIAPEFLYIYLHENHKQSPNVGKCVYYKLSVLGRVSQMENSFHATMFHP